MECPVCQDKMVRAQATSFGEPYDYCRTCKKELTELKKAPISDQNNIGHTVRMIPGTITMPTAPPQFRPMHVLGTPPPPPGQNANNFPWAVPQATNTPSPPPTTTMPPFAPNDIVVCIKLSPMLDLSSNKRYIITGCSPYIGVSSGWIVHLAADDSGKPNSYDADRFIHASKHGTLTKFQRGMYARCANAYYPHMTWGTLYPVLDVNSAGDIKVHQDDGNECWFPEHHFT